MLVSSSGNTTYFKNRAAMLVLDNTLLNLIMACNNPPLMSLGCFHSDRTFKSRFWKKVRDYDDETTRTSTLLSSYSAKVSAGDLVGMWGDPFRSKKSLSIACIKGSKSLLKHTGLRYHMLTLYPIKLQHFDFGTVVGLFPFERTENG